MGLLSFHAERKRRKKQRVAKDAAIAKIGKLRSKVEAIAYDAEKVSGLIFRTHDHSAQDLLARLEKVRSGAGVLRDLVEHWASFGVILADDHKDVLEEVIEFEREIRDLEIDVRNRKPTLWESISTSLGSIVRTIGSIVSIFKFGFIGFEATPSLPDYSSG